MQEFIKKLRDKLPTTSQQILTTIAIIISMILVGCLFKDVIEYVILLLLVIIIFCGDSINAALKEQTKQRESERLYRSEVQAEIKKSRPDEIRDILFPVLTVEICKICGIRKYSLPSELNIKISSDGKRFRIFYEISGIFEDGLIVKSVLNEALWGRTDPCVFIPHIYITDVQKDIRTSGFVLISGVFIDDGPTYFDILGEYPFGFQPHRRDFQNAPDDVLF